MKQFHSPLPKHGVKFEFYNSELKSHIQQGTNPAFGYPIPIFEEREFNKTSCEMPKRLNKKFRMGKKLPLSPAEIESQAFDVMK